MPEVVTCPKCQRKSRVPDNLMGKRVKCPGCNEVFTAEAGPAPPPPKPQRKADEDDRETYRTEDEPRRRRRSDDDDEDERVSDRPRRRGRDDEDEEDDRPRRSRTREDDEDDERVTRRRGRYGRDDYEDEDDEDEDDDRPRGRRRGGVAADWLRIHRGLGLVLAAIILNVVLSIVLVIGMFAVMGAAFGAMAGPPPAGPGGAAGKAAGGAVALGAGIIILGILAILGSLVALGLKITGHAFCLPSPTAYGSKGLAVATLVLVLTHLGCQILNWIISFASLGAQGLQAVANPMGAGAAANVLATIIGWIGILAAAGAFYVFLFYMRSLAQVTGYDGLARNIVIYAITTVAASVGLCLVSCAGIAIAAGMAGAAAAQQQQGGGVGNPGAAIAGMGALGLVCGGVWVLYFLGMFIWYIVILVQTRGAVATRLRGA
jgi:hypothetical protein